MSFRLAILAFLLLFASLASAQAPLTPDSRSPVIETAGHLAWLRDDGGKLTLDDVRARGVFQVLPGNLREGYTKAALWLRFDVRPDADAPAGWILEIANALIDDVRLYVPDGDGRYAEHRSGDDLPRSQWEIDGRNPAFHLSFDAPKLRRYYLRLWSRNALSLPVRLWQSEAFDADSRNESFVYGMFYGVCGLLLLLRLGALALRNERIDRWFALYFTMYGLTGAISFGHFQQIVPWHGTESDLVLALTFCMLLGVSTSFALAQLESAAVMPRFTRFLQTIMWSSGIGCALLVLLGRFGAGIGAAQMIMLAGAVFLTAAGIRLALQGHRPARYFLIAFGLFYLAVMARHLVDLGWLASNPLGEYGTAAAALLHMLAVSVNIIRRNNEAKLAKLAEQSTLNAMLEAQVAARTAELTAEVAARAAVVSELRDALTAETAARQTQRDFVAMVSHEFRTPLAIIDTSAQRIAGTAQANFEATRVRCTNIRKAAQRMTQLMDQFLSLDRLDGDLRAFRRESCNPREIVASVAEELGQERLVLECSDLPSRTSCDVSYLRIALYNLLTNALRYSPPDAPVSFIARGLPDGGIEFVVGDDGPGIAPDELPKIFDRYYRGRASKTQSGAGLGLYLVDHIARLHGGSVRVQSALGQGTRFFLLLPGTNGS